MRKYNTHSGFACFVRNLTERPIPLSVPLGAMGREPALTPQGVEAIKAQNRARYCATTDNQTLPDVTLRARGIREGRNGTDTARAGIVVTVSPVGVCSCLKQGLSMLNGHFTLNTS